MKRTLIPIHRGELDLGIMRDVRLNQMDREEYVLPVRVFAPMSPARISARAFTRPGTRHETKQASIKRGLILVAAAAFMPLA